MDVAAAKSTLDIGGDDPRRLYVVMPASNEGERIGDVLAALPTAIRSSNRAYPVRVVVVDDCSSDATGEIARCSGAMVLRHEHNRGAGAATRTGLLYALRQRDCAFVATIDADGQHAVDDLTRMIAFAEERGSAVVVGNRLHGGNLTTMPWHRVFGNRVLDVVGSVLFGLKHVDTQCGLRVFSAEALPAIAAFRIDRYGFCTEMLWRAKRAQLRIDSLPIAVTYSRDTLIKGQRPWGIFRLVFDLVIVRLTPQRFVRQPMASSVDGDSVGLVGHPIGSRHDSEETTTAFETTRSSSARSPSGTAGRGESRRAARR